MIITKIIKDMTIPIGFMQTRNIPGLTILSSFDWENMKITSEVYEYSVDSENNMGIDITNSFISFKEINISNNTINMFHIESGNIKDKLNQWLFSITKAYIENITDGNGTKVFSGASITSLSI